MSLVINTNTIANTVRNTLTTNQANLQKSLARLSSGSKIVHPTDDAGGLSVAAKLEATLNRNARTQQNVQNALSFLQVQDGALSQVAGILDRMSELKVMSLDPTKNSTDLANYDTEFTQLQSQLSNIKSEDFNGIGLFNPNNNLTVYTTEAGDSAGEPTVTASRNGVFQEVGNITYGGATGSFAVQEYNAKVDYSADGTNEIATATAVTYVKSTSSDGTVRLGYISDNDAKVDAAAAGDMSFADAVTAGAIVEISNVDAIYDYEADVVKSDIFRAGDAAGGLSTHAGGEVVFDDASGEFYISTGTTLIYDGASESTAAATINTTAGEFLKMGDYKAASDYTAYSTSEAYDVGDIVSDGSDLYVAKAAVAAGGALPSNTAASWTQLTSYAQSGSDLLTTSNTLSNYTVGDFQTFIQATATARAQNGAESARLESSIEMLKANQGNLDAARSRLADVDIALESTNLAKQNILVQSAAAMLTQANASQNIALQLLG
jgi:flagellin